VAKFKRGGRLPPRWPYEIEQEDGQSSPEDTQDLKIKEPSNKYSNIRKRSNLFEIATSST
jgi:hypothetical protein